MLAIISPSKTQDFSECNIENFSQTRQQESSNELIDILKNKSQAQISKLMSISEKLSALNFERFPAPRGCRLTTFAPWPSFPPSL